jgi:hypothetical protein
MQISCPHVEKSCTSEFYADRKLGVSETVRTAAAAVHIFTGNNVGPKGDLASRALQVRLDVDRVDPENREFRHPDPIGWTQANRAAILAALYTVLLGNPALDLPNDAPMKTRFKMWYRLVGAAVEYASRCAVLPGPVEFGTLFLNQEADDEEATSLAEMLVALDEIMKGRPLAALGFTAAEVAKAIKPSGGLDYNSEDANAMIIRGFMFPNHAGGPISSKAVAKRLRGHLNHRVKHGKQTLVLTSKLDKNDEVLRFQIDMR